MLYYADLKHRFLCAGSEQLIPGKFLHYNVLPRRLDICVFLILVLDIAELDEID